ncbi:MAG: hypothetical protein QW724_07420 [Nitrososphaerota archaeon]
MNRYDLDIKLACRFYQYPGSWEKILSILSSNGWVRADRGAVKDGLEVNFTAESLDGLEILLSLKSKEGLPSPKVFRTLLECLLTECWYVDVYFCLRNIDVGKVSKELGLSIKSNEVRRLKLEGSEIIFEAYPPMNKAVFSYRVGVGDIGRIEKMHIKLFGKISNSKGKGG